MNSNEQFPGAAAVLRRLEVARERREQLHKRRTELGLTLKEVGVASGLSPTKVSFCEKGTESLDEDSYRRITIALGIPGGELIPNPDGPPDSMKNRPHRKNRPEPTPLA